MVVGGHLALDFTNTVDDPLGPGCHDHAGTYPDIIDWSVRTGTVTDSQAARLLRAASRRPAHAAAVVERAHSLRSALSDVFGGVVESSSQIPSRTWTRLRPFVVDAFASAVLEGGPQGRRRYAWTHSEELTVVLHPIAFAAAQLLVSDDLDRIKRCARCPWFFLDNSKNRSRRWCTMNDCGKAVKMERYVARRAAARRSRL
jgi:predicted RNA-binding Zn ribbon-like protein